MDKVNILLVDDRPENLLALEAILADLDENLVRAYSGEEALKRLLTQDFAVILLDVQMPKLDGFEVLELIDREVAVVFVTAFDQYAMKAFDAAAIDYLLKPFGADRLHTALQRVRRRLGEKQSMPPAGELKAAARAPDEYTERIVVKDGSRVQIIPVSKLD